MFRYLERKYSKSVVCDFLVNDKFVIKWNVNFFMGFAQNVAFLDNAVQNAKLTSFDVWLIPPFIMYNI